MKRLDQRLLWGLLLVAAGVFYLLQNLGYITWGSLVWAGAFGVGAVIFLASCEAKGMKVANCPRYIREWIEKEVTQSEER